MAVGGCGAAVACRGRVWQGLAGQGRAAALIGQAECRATVCAAGIRWLPAIAQCKSTAIIPFSVKVIFHGLSGRRIR